MTDNEVGGFGITEAEDLLFVTDFVLVKQKVTCVTISFEDEPGNSPEPSITDENTFTRVFGTCDWSVMCIVAQDGSTFARLRFNAGPGGEIKIPVCVDYNVEFDAADFEIWQQQYLTNVIEDTAFSLTGKSKKSKTAEAEEIGVFGSTDFDTMSVSCPDDLIEELELMHPSERQAFMDELAVRSDFWDETEVLYE